MAEITHEGFWVRWGSLDSLSKSLFALSNLTLLIAVAPIFHTIFLHDHAVAPVWSEAYLTEAPWKAWWLLGWTGTTILFWWRFSARQDEMFNRMQNWALGMGGAAAAVLLTIWAFLSDVGILPSMTAVPTFWTLILCVSAFWLRAVSRWL